MFLNVFRHKKNYQYKPLTIQDKRFFIQTLNTIQNLVISMIANGVVVLPNDRKKNVKKTHLLHYFIAKKIKQQKNNGKIKTNNYVYQDVITTKQLIVSCIEKSKKDYFNKLISNIVIVKKDNKNSNISKILLCLSKKFFTKLPKESKSKCIKDIIFMEKTINIVNTNFKKHLPSAKKAGKILISKMNNRINSVPKILKFQSKN